MGPTVRQVRDNEKGGAVANWKPEGYSSVSPYLIVSDAKATMAFLRKAFDAEPLRIHQRPDGTLMHAEARIDDTVVMLADATDGWSAVPAHVHVYVADVDASYRRALEAGGKSVMEPIRKGDADKRGGVQDPGGTTWWLATQQG
jgi:PhnB protein